jgi:hypothetical protein
MKLVAVTRIMNEADIVEAFVRHTAHYVDHHIFIDNGSVDGTLEILRNLEREGLGITLYASTSRSFIESQALTFMYGRAVADHAADWVLFLDTDEFFDDREIDVPLRDHLARFEAANPDFAAIQVRLRDYHATPDDPPHTIVACRMTQCQPISDNRKVFVKGTLLDRRVVILPGGHAARIDDGQECPTMLDTALSHAHYPIRSPYQWLSKSVIGWCRVLASGPEMIRTGHATHYRGPFDVLRSEPAKLLRNRALMDTLTTRPGMTHNPIVYRGGELRYTGPIDYQMRTVQFIMQYLHELAVQHGDMMEIANKLGDLVRRDEGEFRRLT